MFAVVGYHAVVCDAFIFDPANTSPKHVLPYIAVICVCNSYNIAGVHSYCEVLPLYIDLHLVQAAVNQLVISGKRFH